MPSPPVPEAPPPRAALPPPQPAGAAAPSGTPRVGMHLLAEEEDDVSVLTFHTLGTKEPAAAAQTSDGAPGGTSYVKSARASLGRLLRENQAADENEAGSLSRISEEGGSHLSASCHSSGRSPSPAAVRSEMEKMDEEEGVREDDDDTISLAESILDSASKVLSDIGASPYYARGQKSASPGPPSTAKKPSDDGTHDGSEERDRKRCTAKNLDLIGSLRSRAKKESASGEGTGEGRQLEVASTFLGSYFGDENAQRGSGNDNNSSNGNNNGNSGGNTSGKSGKNNTNTHHSPKKGKESKGKESTDDEEGHLRQLESETRQLHRLLKERQKDTRRASLSLGSSIRKATVLLERRAAGRAAHG